MALVRRITIFLLIITSVCFAAFEGWNYLTADDTLPVISCTTEEIEVSIDADEVALLDGVTAWDDKDGDITESVYVESISDFIRVGVSNVTYCVVDSDNHVDKLTRRVIYSDYTSPEISLNAPLVLYVGQTFTALDYLGASDCIDGDITSQLSVTSSTVDTTGEGTYELTAKVTNSKGDAVSLTLPVKVLPSEELMASIELSTYLVYIEVGDSIDPTTYIESAAGYFGDEIDTDEVSIKSKVDIENEGVYVVKYTVVDELGYTGTTYLTVVVEE